MARIALRATANLVSRAIQEERESTTNNGNGDFASLGAFHKRIDALERR